VWYQSERLMTQSGPSYEYMLEYGSFLGVIEWAVYSRIEGLSSRVIDNHGSL
jgi:hypothetical protein